MLGFLFAVSLAHAATGSSALVVTLSNGGVERGEIIGNVEGKSLLVRHADGSVVAVATSQIRSIEAESGSSRTTDSAGPDEGVLQMFIPEGVRVLVDGSERTSDLREGLTLSTGEHRLDFRVKGKDQHMTVNVIEGKQTNVVIDQHGKTLGVSFE